MIEKTEQIQLPQDENWQEKLRQKKEDYKNRDQDFYTFCAIHLLNKLLDEGSVHRDAVYNTLSAEPNFDEKTFEHAFQIIYEYSIYIDFLKSNLSKVQPENTTEFKQEEQPISLPDDLEWIEKLKAKNNTLLEAIKLLDNTGELNQTDKDNRNAKAYTVNILTILLNLQPGQELPYEECARVLQSKMKTFNENSYKIAWRVVSVFTTSQALL